MSHVTSSSMEALTLTAHEKQQVERANTTGLRPVVFVYGFANAVSEGAKELYRTFHVPASGAPIVHAATANLSPWAETKVDTQSPKRGPLLIVSGGNDRTVRWTVATASFECEPRNVGVTGIVEKSNRGHAITIESGWREVVETVLRIESGRNSHAGSSDSL